MGATVASFASSGARIQRDKPLVEVPGPGTYAVDKDLNYALKPYTCHPGGFVSADKRFRIAGPFTPGPG